MRSWPDTASPTPTISTAHFGKVIFSARHTAIETCQSTRCTSPPHLQSTGNPSLEAFRRDAAALIADSPSNRPGGRALVLSVATGALLAAGTSASHASTGSVSVPVELDQQPLAPLEQALASAPEILQVPKLAELGRLAEQLARGTERDTDRASREAAARQPLTMAPVSEH